MAGNNQKTEQRGGKREGAGRPKGYSQDREPLSVRQVKEMLEKAKSYAEKHNKTIDEILLDFIYGETGIVIGVDDTETVLLKKVGVRDRIACIKLWKEYTSPKLAEGSEGDKQVGPAIYLPKQRPTFKVV